MRRALFLRALADDKGGSGEVERALFFGVTGAAVSDACLYLSSSALERASFQLELFVVGEHLQEGCRERSELLAVVRAHAMHLLADERIHGEEQGKPAVLMTPFLELSQVLERPCSHRELTDVEVLQGDEERMQLVHDLGFGAGCRGLINGDHPQQVLGILGQARFLSDLLVAGANLSHLVEMNEAVNQVVPLDSLHELAVRLPM